MVRSRRLGSYYGLVAITIVLGLIVSIYPISNTYALLRPEFLCLFIIYWVMNTPQYFGVFLAWLVGITQDLIEGVVWGAHAMALAVVAYVCLVAYQRMKNYSVWHQTFWVFILVGFHQVMANWVQGLSGYNARPADLVLSTVVSALFWPLIFLSIGRLRVQYRVN